MSTYVTPSLPELKLVPSPRLAVVVSRFNTTITEGLCNGALEWLGEHGITVAAQDIFSAPGAFEMPLLAQTLARTGKYEGVICLGCVIKGDTAHFEFISLGATIGMMQASLETEVPVAFGVLTTYTEDQATQRALPDVHNKGREAAAACVESLALLRRIKED
ncbi:6,7-dimethyl-8-ribityllumazine synthase [Acetobacter thailandicus]|uniref:6,7-dimethyl-8-ribityllumazine synthase n=1 Tax=Acetobacter thailandicus TaxID=1502842 RepID=UPI001BA525E9|nr:6,7-dimethyl-8-ribityllumazine synthase [Acetobacter thailandicus]MBS0959243.1 6,7-dimethyl-8-ribityllumazine synthase [Acetobacter thailandicus]MBS0984860.1 6,7-dimethyl-8-ribityllumazine synthase [Acetobacter thailandicus]